MAPRWRTFLMILKKRPLLQPPLLRCVFAFCLPFWLRETPKRTEENRSQDAQDGERTVPMDTTGGGGSGKMWHNKIVPHFAVVFKDQSHLLMCRGGWASQASKHQT